MRADPLNLPPLSIATARAGLLEQFADPVLRRRATMLWGPRGVGKSSVVRQVAEHHRVPLVDLRLTTIEPVDLRGAIFADDTRRRTVWFPPEFLPDADGGGADAAGILFLDELTAADPRLQASAYSLILDRHVGRYRLPEGWMVVAAGNASFQDDGVHDMSAALADRMFHFNVHPSIDAFLEHAIERGFAPEVMAYLRVRPDRLDDSAAQRAADHLVGASPRGWEDVSDVLRSGLSEPARRSYVQGRLGAAHAAEFFGVLRALREAVDVAALLEAAPGAATAALLPASLDALYGMVYGLLARVESEATMRRALEIVDALPDARPREPLPIREAQTLAMELLMRRALERGLETAILDHPAYHRHLARREAADARTR